MDIQFLITAFVTLFVMIDPIGMTPIFIALTNGMSSAQRRLIAIRACLVALVVLTAFLLVGEALLTGIGITLPAFRIAGGILLFLTAMEMLFEKRTPRREGSAETDQSLENDPSVFPLAIPLIAGPGTITALILLAAERSDILGLGMVWLVLVSVLAIVMTLFALSGHIAKLLGKTGMVVITRIFGLLLAALSVQFILDGLNIALG